ncbi:MAG: type II toxin-antitoxin system PemK/MazF family toxin [Solirubrobacterales bacterium]|nr:type II toxin-antitoxin system PemK/MazF family toxin [Solirubrobacterales bacterium]
MTHGEVWWLEHPEIGRRPACVLTRSNAVPVLQQVVVALATTRIRGIDTEVALDRSDGMPRDCVLTLDNLWTVPKTLLTEKILTLSPTRAQELCRALRIATAC